MHLQLAAHSVPLLLSRVRGAGSPASDAQRRDVHCAGLAAGAPLRSTLPSPRLAYLCLCVVVQRALQEHNVLAAAAVYRSVSLATLAARLGLGEGAEAAARAEAVAARMIAEGRVVGSIDQVDSMVDFEAAQRTGTAAAAAAVPASAASAAASMLQDDGPTGASDSAGDASATSLAEPPSVAALLAWDASIKRACLAVKGALDAVSAAHPRFTPA